MSQPICALLRYFCTVIVEIMHSKKVFLALGLFLGALTLSAQILHPANWSSSVSANQAKVGDELTLIFQATIDKDWYLYSSEFTCEDGPIKTAFTFKPNASFKLIGKIEPVGAVDKHDEIFECDVKIFKKTGEFRQKVKVLSANLKIEGEYEYQVCTDIDGKCIPFNEEFAFNDIKVSGGSAPKNPEPEKKENNQSSFATVIDTSTVVKQVATENYGERKGPVLDKAILEGESSIHEESFLGYLIFAFILGLTSLVTPCVFPMIPMTVTFFLKDNQSRKEGIKKALVFGFSIVFIYTLAGTLFALLLGAEGLNALATHWAPNLFVFVIFIVFALSFLGLFEINAPYQLVNKVDQQAEKGGWIGVFFMASTLVLVSFSCTIPIVGNVIVLAAGGQIIKPILAMLSYSLAFAIPFTLFAIFPEWIKSLPKSGG